MKDGAVAMGSVETAPCVVLPEGDVAHAGIKPTTLLGPRSNQLS